MRNFLFLLIPCVLFFGCTSPDSEKLLPDSGPTTVDLIQGEGGGSNSMAVYGDGRRADYVGTPIMSGYAPNSHYSLSHIRELQRDFQKVPNPQIVAYVYPHLNGGQLPIPGYFTVFNLYDREHYALESEGYHDQ